MRIARVVPPVHAYVSCWHGARGMQFERRLERQLGASGARQCDERSANENASTKRRTNRIGSDDTPSGARALAPKTLAALRPERIAYPSAYVLRPLLKLSYPVVWFINMLANGLLRLFGVKVCARARRRNSPPRSSRCW